MLKWNGNMLCGRGKNQQVDLKLSLVLWFMQTVTQIDNEGNKNTCKWHLDVIFNTKQT